jgi:hypothetical protein
MEVEIAMEEKQIGSITVKTGFAEMFKGGVIMDVVTPEQARIAEDSGATAVMAGHDHHYERLLVDGIPYFVNGLGGGARYSLGAIVPGSQVQYQGDYGAMHVEASEAQIRFEFITRQGEVIDSYTITAVP